MKINKHSEEDVKTQLTPLNVQYVETSDLPKLPNMAKFIKTLEALLSNLDVLYMTDCKIGDDIEDLAKELRKMICNGVPYACITRKDRVTTYTLDELLELARYYQMSNAEMEMQRQSWAEGEKGIREGEIADGRVTVVKRP